MSRDPQYKYYNCSLVPSNLLSDPTTSSYKQIRFNEDMTIPLLDNPSNFEMSIIRFQADCSTLPLFIPIIQPAPNTDPNKTVYGVVITVSSGGTIASSNTHFIQYVSSTSDISAPSLPQSFDNLYYWVRTFKDFVDMINVALVAAYDEAVAQIEGFDTGSHAAPYVYYNSDTDKFSLYYDSSLTQNIYFNLNLSLLLKNFQVTKSIIYGDSFFKIILDNPLGMNSYSHGGINYGFVTQERSSTDVFTPVSSIVFTTSMNVDSEQVSAPVSLDGTFTISTSTVNTEKIITDITLPLTSGAYDYKGMISYMPTVYRFIRLSSLPYGLQNFNFALKWLCRTDGRMYSVYMPNNGSAFLKAMFKRISFN